MRITTHIAAGGERALTRIPFPRYEIKDCLNADNKIDRVKAQKAFEVGDTNDYCPFMAASSDDEMVYFAAMTFMELFHDAYQELIAVSDDCYEGSRCRQDEHLERKIGKGKYVYARQDIRRTADGVKVKLSVGNPHGVVGQSEAEAWEFTSTCAQLWLRMMAQIDWLSVECPERPEIIEEMRERNRKAELRHTYAKCERRTYGAGGALCSPAKFDCPFYKAGRCEYKD